MDTVTFIPRGTLMTTEEITHETLDGLLGALPNKHYHIVQYVSIAAAKAETGGSDIVLAYVAETETFYRWVSSSGVAADDLRVLITGDGGNSRWIGVAGLYPYVPQTHNSLASIQGGVAANHYHIAEFTTVVLAEAATGGTDVVLAYVTENETFYRYVAASGATRDGTRVLNTGDSGNTRWIAVAGKYHYEELIAENVRITPLGGIAIRMINGDATTAVKGYVVDPKDGVDDTAQAIPVGGVDPIGVWYDTPAAGEWGWVVVSGIAEVYFAGSTTAGYFCRVTITADTGDAPGYAIAEALPTPPLATDKHFQEIGHCIQSRTGAGLAKVVLHFN